MTLPRVTVVLVNWKRCADTLACLDSLRQLDYPSCDIVVIDNGSGDDSVMRLRAAHPNVTVIAEPDNTGFVGGSNLGIAHAHARGAEYVLLLNNDTIVARDLLTRLVEAAVGEGVAAVGPTIYFHERPEVIWSAGGSIDWRRGVTRMLRLNQRDDENTEREAAPRRVDFVTGCCLLVSLAAVERVGRLDERFFAYFEEVEWCVRMQRAGYCVLYVPAARVWHKIDLHEQGSSPLIHYYMTRNRLLFLQATGAPWSAWVHTLVLEYARTLASWSIRPKWRSRRRQRDVMMRAIADYFRGRLGRAPEYER